VAKYYVGRLNVTVKKATFMKHFQDRNEPSKPFAHILKRASDSFQRASKWAKLTRPIGLTNIQCRFAASPTLSTTATLCWKLFKSWRAFLEAATSTHASFSSENPLYMHPWLEVNTNRPPLSTLCTSRKINIVTANAFGQTEYNSGLPRWLPRHFGENKVQQHQCMGSYDTTIQ